MTKNAVWTVRSKATMSRAAISIGAASIIRTTVASTPQTKIGSRVQVMPGARIVMMVARRLKPEQAHRDPDQGEEADVGVDARRALVTQWLVAGPAGLEAAEEDRRDEDDAGGHQQPERERLDPRVGHPPGADHQRHDPVGKRAQDARGHHSHHHRPVHADQGQVLVGAEHVGVGLEQLGADQHRVDAADEEEDADPDQVLQGHDLVVGAEAEVAAEALALGLVLSQRGRVAHQSPDRVIGESKADQEAEDPEQVAEQNRDVVLPGFRGEVGDARRVNPAAYPIADEPADDGPDDSRQKVEADQRRQAGRLAAGIAIAVIRLSSSVLVRRSWNRGPGPWLWARTAPVAARSTSQIASAGQRGRPGTCSRARPRRARRSGC